MCLQLRLKSSCARAIKGSFALIHAIPINGFGHHWNRVVCGCEHMHMQVHGPELLHMQL